MRVYFPLLRAYGCTLCAQVDEGKFAIENYLRCLFMGQVVKPPASRVCAGASERQRLGDAPTLDAVGYKPPSPFGEEMPRTSVHVVQVLEPLAVEVVVGR